MKTIGDAYLCFAGSGNGEQGTGNGEAERVARVAIDMVASEFYWPTATAAANSQQQTANRLQFRIGIHSGPVTAGVIGTERLQYDIWGDTVNVASRMESNGIPGRVNISADTASILRDLAEFSIESRGTIEVKGKGTMEMFLLTAAYAG